MPRLQKDLHYVGIDSGQSGGLVWLDPNGKVNGCNKMPATERDIWERFFTLPTSTVAVIEKVHAMPKQGVSSTFKFGRGYGGLRMALIAAGISFEEVTPRTWQKGLGIPPKKKTETGTQWKNRLKAMAQQLFPQEKVTLATADALLIATYCRRKHTGTL